MDVFAVCAQQLDRVYRSDWQSMKIEKASIHAQNLVYSVA